MSTSVPPSGFNRNRQTTVTPVWQRQQQGDRRPQQLARSSLPLLRLLLVWLGLIAAMLGLVYKLYQLQVVTASELRAKAQKQQLVEWRPFIPRRPVIDRNANVLAMDRPVHSLYVHPQLFDEPPEKVAQQLATVLNLPKAKLEKLFQTQDTGIRVMPTISEDTAKQITQLRLNGLEVVRQYSRHYPQQDLVADVVGYVDTDRQGQAGVERSQEKLLEHAVNPVKLRREGNGSFVSHDLPPGFVRIDDLRLQLTIDNRLQQVAHSQLKQQLQKFQAKRGSVIVMDARDGAIRAIASQPSYDSNEYFNSDLGLFKNWVLSDLYEPGSTFKPLNIAITLETGAIKPTDVFPDPEVIKVDGWPIRNFEPDDRTALTVPQVLQHSSNVAMVQIIQRLPPADYYNWLQRLGLSQAVGIDLPFEAPGQIKHKQQFVTSPIEPATASFGQGGFLLTPIKLVQLHAAIANGGKLVTPHVVQGLVDAQGQSAWQPVLSVPKQIFSPQVTQTVLEMMETVVTEGSGIVAQVPGYRIAGKTGTAQKASSSGGYHSSAKITSFVGILPVESPRYVVLAVVDEPQKGVAFGSTVAAPIVKSVMETLISIEQLPPSQPVSSTPPPAQPATTSSE